MVLRTYWRQVGVLGAALSVSGCLTDQVTTGQLQAASGAAAAQIRTVKVGATDEVGANAGFIPIIGALVSGDNSEINSQRSEGWKASGPLKEWSVAVVLDPATRSNVFKGGAKSFAAGARTAVVPLGEALTINTPVVFGAVYEEVDILQSPGEAKPNHDLVVTPSIVNYEHVYGGGLVSTITSNITLGMSVEGGQKPLHSGQYESGFVGASFSAGSEFSSSSHAENHAYAVTGAVITALGKGINDYQASEDVRSWLNERKKKDDKSGDMEVAGFGIADNLREMLGYWRSGGEIDPAQFRRAIGYAETLAEDAGFDVAQMRGFNELAKKIVRQSDFEAMIPEGLSAAERQEQVIAQKTAMYRRVNLSYMQALLAETPEAGAQHLRAYADAVREIGDADAIELAQQADRLAAKQKLAATMVSGVPLVGDAVDVYSVATGKNAISGETLTAVDYAFAAVPILPSTLDLVVRQSDEAVTAMSRAVSVSEANPAAVSKATGHSAVDVSQMSEVLSPRHGRIGKAALEGFDARAYAAIDEFADTSAGREALETWQQAERLGRAKADAAFEALQGRTTDELLQDTEFLDALQVARSDTRAVAALKRADLSDRTALFEFEESLYGRLELDPATRQLVNNGQGIVDRKAFQSIRDDLGAATGRDGTHADQAWERIRRDVRSKAEKSGMVSVDEGFELADYVDPQALDIEVLNVTNKPPRTGDIGSDRDVTYRLVTKRTTPEGQPIKVDLPADYVKDHYLTALYKTLNPERTVKTGEDLTDWGAAMDHTVTDEWALDAYRPGMDIFEYVNNRAARPGASAAEDMRDTFAYKGHEWYELAEDATRNGNMARAQALNAEGARQTWKQYENLIVARLPDGRTVGDALPLKAQKTYRWLRNIGEEVTFPDGTKRTVSTAEAEVALAEMNLTLRSASSYLAETFEAAIKLRPGV